MPLVRKGRITWIRVKFMKCGFAFKRFGVSLAVKTTLPMDQNNSVNKSVETPRGQNDSFQFTV